MVEKCSIILSHTKKGRGAGLHKLIIDFSACNPNYDLRCACQTACAFLEINHILCHIRFVYIK